MFEQQSNRKTRILVILFVLVVLAVGAMVFAISRSNDDSKGSTSPARQMIQQRRKVVMEIMTAIKSHASANGGTFPSVTEVNEVVKDRLGSQPLEPATQKAFVFQSGSPNAPHEIQYAIRATCSNNSYAIKLTSSSSDVALRIQDNLTDYFCLSSHIDFRR